MGHNPSQYTGSVLSCGYQSSLCLLRLSDKSVPGYLAHKGHIPIRTCCELPGAVTIHLLYPQTAEFDTETAVRPTGGGQALEQSAALSRPRGDLPSASILCSPSADSSEELKGFAQVGDWTSRAMPEPRRECFWISVLGIQCNRTLPLGPYKDCL